MWGFESTSSTSCIFGSNHDDGPFGSNNNAYRQRVPNASNHSPGDYLGWHHN